MLIGEFASVCNVTKKMLRHYDEIELLKPSGVDTENGYRIYTEEQAKRLDWIIVLKNLGFGLSEIRKMLDNTIDNEAFIAQLKQKRVEISSAIDRHIQKRVSIDGLIRLIQKEGLSLDKTIKLTDINANSVHEIKKNIPNTEVFLENIANLLTDANSDDHLSILRIDIWRFKQINDEYGFDVGDATIVAYFDIIRSCADNYGGVIARSHGDEFLVCVVHKENEVQNIANQIIKSISEYDFKPLGCMRDEMACYMGICSTRIKDLSDVRQVIQNSHAALNDRNHSGDYKNKYCILN